MSDTSPNLNLPLIAPAQAMKHITHNEALARLDALTQLSVESFGALQPPAGAQEGECHVTGTGAQGAWAGHDGQVAVFSNGGWLFVPPRAGWRAWDLQGAVLRVLTAGQWLPVDPSFNNVDGLGINAAYDTVNRLTLASDASLFNHAGAGHQLKLNKAATADTAALLFQSDFTGHAEIGLAGENDLSFKVSDDGTNFATALRVRSTDGLVETPCLRSGRVYVEQETVVDIPTPGDGGMIAISLVNPNYPQTPHSGLFSYDAGGTLHLFALASGSGFNTMGSTVLTGTAGVSGKSNLSVQAGKLQLENRFVAHSYYSYTFLNTY